ncbi:major facilitator superfamily domain-containing protein [Aspergillus transmontanensis]|uniref:Major facilitator superfamily domain-containing protein n=1 Tax=Aspergillus transmontanensis TaxID=1034304 RepID=A0A5N6W3N7_9EURO|nr:major facilitator superfamily domain-containing protein [Aspergillus transmontanensis]
MLVDASADHAPEQHSLHEKKSPGLQDTNLDQQSSTSPSDEGEYPTGLRLTFVVVALILAIFLTSLDFTIIATAIPRITDDFHSLGDVAWYGSAFFLVTAGFQTAWGKAYLFFSLKITFLLAIFLFEVGSLICGVAPSSVALIVGRAIAGLGAAGVNTGSFTLAAFCAPPQKRPIFTGLIGLSYGIASVVGPLLGGVFTEKATWRWCFYINLPVGAVSAIFIIIFFQSPQASKSTDTSSLWSKVMQMDPIGTFLMMASVTCYILAMQYGGLTHPWNSSVVIGLIVGFVAILAVLCGWEVYMGEMAMSCPRLVKKHAIPSAVGFFFFGSYIVVIYYLPIYFQSIDGTSAIGSGVHNLPFILAVSIFTVLSGILISMTGYPAPFVISGAAVGTIGCGLLYTFNIGTSTGKWIGYQILAGVGNGFGVQVPMIMAQGSTEPKDMAATTAILMCFQTVGGAFMQSGAQAAFANRLLIELPRTAPEVDPSAVVAAGATELKSFGSSLEGIRLAYMDGIKVTFAFACASMGVAFILAFFARRARIGGEAVKNAMAAA